MHGSQTFSTIEIQQGTIWFQLEDTKVNAMSARLILLLQNWVLIQSIVTPHILGKVHTGSNKRSVPINRTVSSNWNQRVCRGTEYDDLLLNK